MATKTISVNPDFFSMSKKKKTKKNNIKRNINMLQKNVLKQKMINKIKDYKKKKKIKKDNINKDKINKDNINKDKINKDKINKDNSFKSDYNEAVDFMEEIINKKKTRKHKKKHNKKNKEIQEKQIIPVDTSKNDNSLINTISPDPPYGILKTGKKMLYSKYKQNKEKPILAFKDDSTFGIEQNIKNTVDKFQENIPTRQEKLENLKSKFLENNILKNNKKEKFKIKNKKIKKIFKLGKNKKTSKVGILIKNKRTRRLVDKDIRHLKKKKIKDIKKYLVEHALIKVGSSAPNNILRDMYINCYSSGNITNSGGKNAEDILMHNWNNN